MQEMVEPDRTIMIVSIIGLVIIWGSVAYRRFAQKGDGSAAASDGASTASAPGGSPGRDKKRKKNR